MNNIKERKADHIEICLKEKVQASKIVTGFEDVSLVHRALPELERQKIDITTKVFDYTFSAPFFVGAMTGGTEKATKINIALAEAVEELHIGMGVGSQRIAIDNPNVEKSFSVVREKAPTAFILANIGGPQLVSKYGVKEVKKAIKMVKANALAIHLNPLQEAIQPEGDCNSIGVLENIGLIVESVDVPVMVKETGAGISSRVASALESVGVSAVDVGGVGGTSWAAVEYYRALKENDAVKAQLGLDFWDWGIPTALSIIMVKDVTDLEVVATGGIRSGIDVAKSLALGATAAGMAYPFLDPAVNGTTEDVIAEIEVHLEGLRTAMYLTGCQKVEELSECPLIIQGELKDHLESLDIDYLKIARGTITS